MPDASRGAIHCPLALLSRDVALACFDILVNLVDNAVKYSPGGGRVELMVPIEPEEAVF